MLSPKNGFSLLLAVTILPANGWALDAGQNGMSDVWESLHPAAAANPSGDDDGDGVSNQDEAVAWTDPDDSSSVPRGENAKLIGAAFQFDWQSHAWLRYRVHRSTNLFDWTWNYVPQTGTGQRLFSSDAAPDAKAFRKVVVMPSLNSDTDGLDNLEEAMLGTDPKNWDTDGDKVADDVEFLNGTNPLTTQDTDGDGLPDDWELWIIKSNTNDAVSTLADVTPTTDFDGDGIDDGTEFALGTSPLNAKQNVLFFMTEDQSAHLGCLGTVGLSTPRIDALGNTGLIFTRGFAASPVCSPAKMAIYTGTQSHMNDGYKNVSNYPEGAFPLPVTVDPQYNDEGVHEDLPTLIEILNSRGWFTGISHKVHVEPVRKFSYAKGWGNPDTVATASNIINELVASAGQRPFFMMFNMGSPHLPFRSFPNANGQWSNSGGLTGDGHVLNVNANAIQVPNCYPDVPGVRQDFADYYGAIQVIDGIFGAVVDALAANGQLTNTLIFYTGDHGIGLHRAKQSCYGMGLQVPFLMSGPGMAGGRRINAPVSHTDITPTILDFAGLPPVPPMTGRSLLPIFRGIVDSFTNRATIMAASHHRYDARAVCDGRYYYIRNLRNVTGATLANPGNAMNADSYQSTSPYFNRTYDATVAATGTWQRQLLKDLVEGKLPPEELYDMDADQWMTNNLVANPALQDKLSFLRGEMTRWRIVSEDYNTSSTELVRRIQRFVPPSSGFVVDAGSDQSVSTTNPVINVSLYGFVSDPTATNLWTKVSGPGTVVFADATAVATSATLTGLGTYVLQLQAGTATNSASDTVSIVLADNTGNVLVNPGTETGGISPWNTTTSGTSVGGWSVSTVMPHTGAYGFRWDDDLWAASTGTLSQSVTSGIEGGVPFTASVQVASEPGSGGVAASHVATLRVQWYSNAGMTTLVGTSTTTLTAATGLSTTLKPITISGTVPVSAVAAKLTVEITHSSADNSKTNFIFDDASLAIFSSD